MHLGVCKLHVMKDEQGALNAPNFFKFSMETITMPKATSIQNENSLTPATSPDMGR